VGITLAIGNVLAGRPDATPRPTNVVGGGPFKTLTVDVVTWLLGADPFIQQSEASNEIYALNGGRIKLELGSFEEFHEENLYTSSAPTTRSLMVVPAPQLAETAASPTRSGSSLTIIPETRTVSRSTTCP
jgi:hypothetical protein